MPCRQKGWVKNGKFSRRGMEPPPVKTVATNDPQQFFSKALKDAETVILVDASQPTTQTCSACGYVLPKEQRPLVICPNRDMVEDRDLNASRSTLNYGLATRNLSPLYGGYSVTLVEMETAMRVMGNPIVRVSLINEASDAIATATA